MFAGSLNQMDLSDVLKLLSASHQSGALTLLNPQTAAPVATLYLQAGQLTHAQAQAQMLTGLDAISYCCTLSEESFAFTEGSAPSQQTLATYPTAKLIEKMTEQIHRTKALALAMPGPTDLPLYLAGVSLDGLEATTEDLSLLILCNGSRSVQDLALSTKKNFSDIAKIIANFSKAGIIEIKKPTIPLPTTAAPIPSKSLTPESEEPSAHPPNPASQAPRYWRGKLIED